MKFLNIYYLFTAYADIYIGYRDRLIGAGKT